MNMLKMPEIRYIYLKTYQYKLKIVYKNEERWMPVRSDVFEPVRPSELGKTVSLMQTKSPLCNYDIKHNCPSRLNERHPA